MTHETEQDYIDAVHQECLRLDRHAIGLTLDTQIRAHSIVTYRFLKKLEERLGQLEWRLSSLSGKDAE